MSDDRADKLKAQRERINARLRQIKGQEKRAARKTDTRRKILEGVTALYGCAQSEEYRRLHEQFRTRALTLPGDRAVFGLPPLPASAPRLVTDKAVGGEAPAPELTAELGQPGA